jgi:hypothetical protein
MGCRYFRRYFSGSSVERRRITRWIEADHNFVPVRQVDYHVTGMFRHYSTDRPQDSHGGLRERPIDPAFSGYQEVSADAFERAWAGDSDGWAGPRDATGGGRSNLWSRWLQNIRSRSLGGRRRLGPTRP